MKSFFEKKGPFDLNFLISKTEFAEKKNYKNLNIDNIGTLSEAKENQITFFDNIKYANVVKESKASCILIKKKDVHLLTGTNIEPIITTDPLLDFILIVNIFYPETNYDDNSFLSGTKFKNFLSINTLIDDRVNIGKDFNIGANSTIKKNVIIGNNVKIGSNCSISNTIIEDNVIINDGSVVGKIGFGFKLINNRTMFIPHIGCVILEKNVYLGSNCTIDRGSFSNTIIGSGSMLDNQVHIAHNCKIGKNCFLAGQVGIAGSSMIGNNCMIGGQSGISGHLKIGNNVYIGGGSGVLKDVQDNTKVMGYPARSIKNFIKGKIDDW